MTRETRSQRIERRLRKDRDRQQVRRDGMKDRGKPDTHAVNSAVAEALAYMIAKSHGPGEHWVRRRVMAIEVMDLARRILATRYDGTQSGKAVITKMQPRARYHWILPSLSRLADDDEDR